jgi:transcriptional regulator with XRE-family HTH domain
MLGKRIKELRERNGISRDDLAYNTGISIEVLSRIEDYEMEHVENHELLKIIDNLHLKSAYDFAYLMRLNKISRKFQAYVVGLPKTGTVSLAGIFGNYRASHEFDQWETHQMVIKYKQGLISKKQVCEYLKKRDLMAGLPEMDSAYFNSHYLDILAVEFSEAKFICLIRDCYSWLNSYISHFVEPEREVLKSREIGNGFPFDLPRGSLKERVELVNNFHKYIDTPLSFWSNSYKSILEKLPPNRSLIVKTQEISGKVDEIANFIGVPPQSLIRENSHLNKLKKNIHILHKLDYDFLKAKFDEYCSSLMERFFPGYTLKDFLNGK